MENTIKETPEYSKEIQKRMNDINTFQCCDGELYLKGKDEHGKDFTICFDAYNFLEWIDIEYIKKQTKKHIDQI